jgi:hypothetical protein
MIIVTENQVNGFNRINFAFSEGKTDQLKT